MTHQSAHDAARQAAAQQAQRTLQRAAAFAELHSTSKPLFQKAMRVGANTRTVRIVWPGVLEVFDPKTGEMLARSVPGHPEQLAQSFVPGGPFNQPSTAT